MTETLFFDLCFFPPTYTSGGGVPFHGNANLEYWDGSAWQNLYCSHY